jgi:hypothetical protein
VLTLATVDETDERAGVEEQLSGHASTRS